jgi:hypothetical protein
VTCLSDTNAAALRGAKAVIRAELELLVKEDYCQTLAATG